MGLFDKDDEKEKAKGKAKPKADFSGVQSGSSTTAPRTDPAPAATRTYTVKQGDTLSKIAKGEYGNANDWRRIFEANRDKIENPDLIHPGQELTIPAPETRGGAR